MLVLTRMRDQTINIGPDVSVTVVDIRGDKVRLGIEAPKAIGVHRREVFEAIAREKLLHLKLEELTPELAAQVLLAVIVDYGGGGATRDTQATFISQTLPKIIADPLQAQTVWKIANPLVHPSRYPDRKDACDRLERAWQVLQQHHKTPTQESES